MRTGDLRWLALAVATAAAVGAISAACVAIPFDAPPGPRSGEGGVTIEPARVETSQEARFRITWTVGPSGLVQGGGFRVEFPVDPVHPYLGFTAPHADNRNLLGYIECAVRRGERFTGGAVAQAEGAEARCLLEKGRLAPGTMLVMDYWALAPRVAGTRVLHVESRFSGAWGGRALAAPPALEVAPRPAKALHAVLPGAGRTGDPMTLAVVALDEFGNQARDYRATIEAELDGARLEHQFTPEEQGVALLAGLVVERPGFFRAIVRERPGPEGAPLEARSNPVKVVAGPAEGVLWGDLHFHTGTGAAGRPFRRPDDPGGDNRGNYTRQEEAYAYARDVMRLDFAAATEYAVAAMTDEAWQASLRAARGAHDPPRFTALNGYQWRDRLVLLPGDSGPLVRSSDRRGDEIAELETALSPGAGIPAVLIALWGEVAAGGAQAAEIYSWRNRAAGYDDRPRALEPGASWLRGLGELPASLVAGSDNHWGHPGAVNLTGLEPGAGGLTAVRTSINDRARILDALRRGQAWATTGARIYLSVERRGSDGLVVEAAGTTTLSRIDLVVVDRSGVREVPVLERPALDFEGVAPVPRVEGPGFCYVRVMQEDGEIAWSSPLVLAAEGR